MRGSVPVFFSDGEAGQNPGWDSTANKLAELLTETIGMLSAVTGLKADDFWALSTDSLAGTALRVGSALTLSGWGAQPAADFVENLNEHGCKLPAPRFVDISADGRTCHRGTQEPLPSGATRSLVRVSCCQLYRTPERPQVPLLPQSVSALNASFAHAPRCEPASRQTRSPRATVARRTAHTSGPAPLK